MQRVLDWVYGQVAIWPRPSRTSARLAREVAVEFAELPAEMQEEIAHQTALRPLVRLAAANSTMRALVDRVFVSLYKRDILAGLDWRWYDKLTDEEKADMARTMDPFGPDNYSWFRGTIPAAEEDKISLLYAKSENADNGPLPDDILGLFASPIPRAVNDPAQARETKLRLATLYQRTVRFLAHRFTTAVINRFHHHPYDPEHTNAHCIFVLPGENAAVLWIQRVSTKHLGGVRLSVEHDYRISTDAANEIEHLLHENLLGNEAHERIARVFTDILLQTTPKLVCMDIADDEIRTFGLATNGQWYQQRIQKPV
jgi:hypothetical protein